MTFKKLREKSYPEVKMNVQVYEHEQTGAIHYHTEYNTVQNSFNIVFKTLPENSNGLPHILEHSVLNGSEKFPMHGVFFAMRGRNFETFSNAMTGFDSTQYPFSTIDKKGYFNLLSVYMDAVLFPKLEKETFLQEGWRYTFENPEDMNSQLQYSGVVYNEMKGAYANPNRVAYVELLKQVFANTQYDKYSGGNPLEIPSLTYEDFLKFHKKFYHPSNATIYTFGSIPIEEIHHNLEELGLNRFKKIVIDNEIDIKKLNISGQKYTALHPGEKGYIYFKGYELPDFKNIEDMYETQLLLSLFQSGKNNFQDIFLQKDIGVSVENIAVLPVAKPVIVLNFNMDKLNQDITNELIIKYFEDIIKNGIDNEEFDNIFDSLELQIREGEAGNNNLGMSIISQYLNAEKYSLNEPEDVNDLTILRNLKTKMSNKEYLSNLIEKYFISNNKTFEFISQADPDFGKKIELQTIESLKQKSSILSMEEKIKIVDENKMLETARTKEKNLLLLPKLSLNEIEIKYPEDLKYHEFMIEKAKIYSFVEDTKGVSYVKFHYPLKRQESSDVHIKKLVLDILSNLNMKEMTIEQTSLWKQSKIEGLNAGFTLIPSNDNEFNSYFIIESKSLSENTEMLINKPLDFSKNISFENTELIISSIMNIWREHLNTYQDNAHSFAIIEAQSGFTNHLAFKKLITTDYKMKFLSDVVEQLNNKDLSILSSLESAYKEMFSVAPTVFFCGDKKSEQVMIKQLNKNKDKLLLANEKMFHYTLPYINKNSVLDLNIPVNHVAYVLPVASADEKDGGKLKVLADYIKPYLLTNLREKGGAYSATASYSNNGLFTLFTYRDPNTVETINVFKNLENFLLNTEIDENELNVCKLNLIKEFNKPKEKINKAFRQFNKIMKEQGSQDKLIIDSILNTTSADLKEMIHKYFMNKEPAISISTNHDKIEKYFSGWKKESYVNNEDLSINRKKNN